MNFKEVQNLDIACKNILIIGCPGSGKTYLSDQFKTNHRIIHTDDYIKYGYEQSLYKIIEDINSIDCNTIIEGIQGYRLLRKGVELNCYYPDIVIRLIITEDEMIKTYYKERNNKNIEYVFRMCKANNKILEDYFTYSNNKKPIWIDINNNYSDTVTA